MTARWIAKTWTHEKWLRAFTHAHIIFTLVCVTILSVVADILHVKHLGVDMNIAG